MARHTAEDIKHIADQIRKAKKRDRPFAFLVGAGCSKSAGIPLSKELVTEIQSRWGPEVCRRLSEDRRNDYGACMGCLTLNERKELLDPYLSVAKVNWGHLAIAALMATGYVTRVLTFNFDSVLARACGICSLYPATYDYSVEAPRTTDHIVSPAIIHLHGQGSGLVMLNSEEETRKHAENLVPLIQHTLDRNPLIVIGYSGAADAVFAVLEKTFSGRERLFWLGYDEQPDPHVIRLIEKARMTSEFLGGVNSDLFLIALAQELKCWPPILFTEPETHLLNELAPILDYPKEAGGAAISLRTCVLISMQSLPSAERPLIRISS